MRLWAGLCVVIAGSFAVLGYFGRELYREAPPIPDRVVTTGGRVVYSGADIREGQNVWQSMGGQEVGSVWGHGAYVAPEERTPAQRDAAALAATLTAPRSGRRLDVETDRPGLQFYSGNFLDGAWRTVQGRPVRQGDALCLETQGFPDAVNQPALTGPEFGEAVLRPGQEWATTTTFRFSLAR